ncbi:class I SAM-dependent methyltransferase [Draconibacterium sediminis]|uniref:class I SAM-dependent methyltransferase n=1 Tax=Draconibacterium sediminis TaxID=1544798 RepID=UPI0026E9F4D1|nr:class I SAM-dependent methyltransferase [Draconibacterium sediminis]
MKLLKKIAKSIIPRPILAVIRKGCYSLIDIYESLFGLRDELTPPRSISLVGDGDFKKKGEEFLQYFIEIGGLKKTDRILDVGCGKGRMAVPITNYLSKEGSYEGIDIVADGVNWCTKKITGKYPNFRFQLADVYNKEYNPKGKHQSSAYKFPFEDKSFDFIFLTSVFTHMLPDDMENYLSEISRVLKKNGRCLITYFLLNKESLSLINKKQSRLDFNFKYNYGNYRVENDNTPEIAISFDEKFVRDLYEKHSLQIVEPIHFGSWCERENFLSYQDIIVASKIQN